MSRPTPQPTDHEWVLDTQTICPPRPRPWYYCKWCGVIQRRDGKNGPCKGTYRVELREGEQQP